GPHLVDRLRGDELVAPARLPPAAERAIRRDRALRDARARDDERVLSLDEIDLRSVDAQEVRGAWAVLDERQLGRPRGSRQALGEELGALAAAQEAREPGLDLGGRLQHRVPVRRGGLLETRVREPDVVLDAAVVQERPVDREPDEALEGVRV